MTNKKLELTRRKILGAAGAVGIAGAGAGIGTSALFSDDESFENNSITAGTLDMSVTAKIVEASEYYTSSGDGPDIIGDMATADGDAVVGLQAGDVKPGDWVIICFEIDIGGNPGYVRISTDDFAQYENGQTEPEEDVDPSGGGSLGSPLDGAGAGELQNELLAEVYGSYDDTVTSDDPRAYLSNADPSLSGPAQSTFEQFASGVTLGGSLNPTAVGPSNSPVSQYLLLYLPEDVGNEVQSDALEFDLVFRTEQVRNNTGFVPTQGLVGYWPLDSVGDGTAVDRSGNGNDGTVPGDVSPDDGLVSGAASFDGTDDYIQVVDGGDVPSGASGEELTVSAWMRVDSDANLGSRHILGGVSDEWVLEWNRFGSKTVDLATWGDNTGQGNTSLQEGKWHHVAATWTAGSDVTVYANGSPDKTLDPYGNTSSQTGNDLAIGAWWDGSSTTDPFDGRIDDVRVYERALSDAEVTALYDETVGGIDLRTQTAGPSISPPGTIGRIEINSVRYAGETDTLGSEPAPIQNAAGLVASNNSNVPVPDGSEEYFVVGLHDPDIGSGAPDQRNSLIGIAPLPTGSYDSITAPIAPTPFTDTSDSDYPPSGDTNVTATLWHGPGGSQTGPIKDSDGNLYMDTATVRDI